jgi:methyltransferase (TIGR00027 family)
MTSTLAGLQRVSLTAYDCAAVRAVLHRHSGCESFDYLAADMVRGSGASLLTRASMQLVRLGAYRVAMAVAKHISPGVEVFLFARSAVPDGLIRDALADRADTQVVILGAGLDTSGLRIGAERRRAGLAPGRFFEVDLPAPQAEKRRQVARVLRKRPSLAHDHIVYVPCSFGEEELGAVLRAAGFDPARPTVWVWSGVVHYLPETAVDATVAELKRLSARGSLLFFDYILLEAYQAPDRYRFRRTKARFDAFGEIMSFGFHEGIEHIRGWLAERGLDLVRSYDHADMVEVYEKTTGRSAPSAGAPWSNLCVARF